MFSQRLKELRGNKGISQKELSSVLFVSQQTVAKWETDKTTPNPDMLVKISNYFNITTDYLLNYENEQKKVRSSEDERTLELLAEYPEVGTIVDIMAKLPLSAQKELAEYAKFRADQLEKEHQK